MERKRKRQANADANPFRNGHPEIVSQSPLVSSPSSFDMLTPGKAGNSRQVPAAPEGSSKRHHTLDGVVSVTPERRRSKRLTKPG
ncbi:hypothetical protein N7448_006231 [Penicillium atrosanguineum]|uniref:Uncharacterized protein n=1 Tax=Penicillium atrosanguineum TaxID=1132637 RepID=A0A9W9GY15_9EURO|nr:Prohibitin-2 [Penicillium atrosanguineum]KAJ5132073.1 hypothetical protein N7448_006231 [Penicillium atrosanguineum]KAJ5137717.1 hypothetical protein N7526_003950 [Penicillium atrosanguineum]KAJ5289740.1 Prohibitin-2 [Penicillium atrosanguineum]KAJ5307561.1 hypothetical protein N7476_008217 [Penicillium atrosanguineum]